MLSDHERDQAGLLRRLLRDPLLHFLVIGAAVFWVFQLRSERPARPPAAVIEVTPARVGQLAAQFAEVWRRPPTKAELRGLVEDFVREEVYYREALALGLDRDDALIRQRLRLKMEFLSDAGAEALTPGDAELRAFYAAHPDRFTPSARITFQQVFLGDVDAAAALVALEDGADPGEVGPGSLLPATMQAAAPSAVDGAFGKGFFAAAAALAPGSWQGPVESAYGLHLVRLIEAEPAALPPFEQVMRRVEVEWRQTAADDLREAQYQALRQRYEVLLPAPTADRP